MVTACDITIIIIIYCYHARICGTREVESNCFHSSNCFDNSETIAVSMVTNLTVRDVYMTQWNNLSLMQYLLHKYTLGEPTGSSTVELNWLPPLHPNGAIHYEIVYMWCELNLVYYRLDRHHTTYYHMVSLRF